MLDTQFKKLYDELRQKREKRAEFENLGAGFKRIGRHWGVKWEELKDMRTELNRVRSEVRGARGSLEILAGGGEADANVQHR